MKQPPVHPDPPKSSFDDREQRTVVEAGDVQWDGAEVQDDGHLLPPLDGSVSGVDSPFHSPFRTQPIRLNPLP